MSPTFHEFYKTVPEKLKSIRLDRLLYFYYLNHKSWPNQEELEDIIKAKCPLCQQVGLIDSSHEHFTYCFTCNALHSKTFYVDSSCDHIKDNTYTVLNSEEADKNLISIPFIAADWWGKDEVKSKCSICGKPANGDGL